MDNKQGQPESTQTSGNISDIRFVIGHYGCQIGQLYKRPKTAKVDAAKPRKTPSDARRHRSILNNRPVSLSSVAGRINVRDKH